MTHLLIPLKQGLLKNLIKTMRIGEGGGGWGVGVGGVYHHPISKQTVPFCKVKELYITYYSPFGEQNFAKKCLLSVQI